MRNAEPEAAKEWLPPIWLGPPLLHVDSRTAKLFDRSAWQVLVEEVERVQH